ncbi:MAG: hypothetical protein ACE5LQ_04980, partial [Candidatus Bipolaricaulia bacterium]
EEVEPRVAEEIAEKLQGRTQDVRDAVRVARLAPDLGVERAISLLLPQGSGGVTLTKISDPV